MPFAVARGQAEAGAVKVLAVTNAVRAEAAPEIPTVAEVAYPDLTLGGLLRLFGPKDMPPALQERIASEVRQIRPSRGRFAVPFVAWLSGSP
jgi:tripartite-type tricarboxylate transporter receptor subunit TctC